MKGRDLFHAPRAAMNKHATPDLEDLRHALADRMDLLPPEQWSAPMLMALIGVFDARLVAMGLEARQARNPADLRVISGGA